jgi:hypothetical protein
MAGTNLFYGRKPTPISGQKNGDKKIPNLILPVILLSPFFCHKIPIRRSCLRWLRRGQARNPELHGWHPIFPLWPKTDIDFRPKEWGQENTQPDPTSHSLVPILLS